MDSWNQQEGHPHKPYIYKYVIVQTEQGMCIHGYLICHWDTWNTVSPHNGDGTWAKLSQEWQ